MKITAKLFILGIGLTFGGLITSAPVEAKNIVTSNYELGRFARNAPVKYPLLRSKRSLSETPPRVDFIDISSHNGEISVEQFQKMKNTGIKGVVVKLTESSFDFISRFNFDFNVDYLGRFPCVILFKEESVLSKDIYEGVLPFIMIHTKPNYAALAKQYNYDYRTVKRYYEGGISNKLPLSKKATIRVETTPGLSAQVDWKENLKLVNKFGEVISCNIFLYVLGYSKIKYLELTFNHSQTTLFRCLTNAFQYTR